jgi:hypothetical protein
LPRTTRTKRQRDKDNAQKAYLDNLADTATRDLAAARTTPERTSEPEPTLDEIVQADELQTGRAFDSGTTTFRSPSTDQFPDDPYIAKRRELASGTASQPRRGITASGASSTRCPASSNTPAVIGSSSTTPSETW